MSDLNLVLTKLYGEEKSRELTQRIDKHISELPQQYSFEKQPNWYKNMNVYITYPDSIEGPYESPLQNLRDHLDWVKNLGCTAVHILPFLDSPLVDKGFDISNFYKVRHDLGTVQDIQAINHRAKELGIQIFMDLVCNHISDQHEWFQKAENGDEYYRNFFFYSKDKPEYVRSFNNEFGKYAEYIVDGKPKEVYIVFPDTVGEIPHWRQGKDGYWYYHTFYPQQPDLNWFNPEVFYEFAKIIIHWSSFGFHFRLDAIPFVGKGIYKDNANDDENTHSIVRGLYHIGRMINPNCALLVETYESTQSVINYFGTTNSPETTLSYNFHLCTNTWLTLVKEDTNYFKECFTSTIAVPIHGEWITFLRNHDELSIAFIDDHLRDSLVETLKPLGAAFREGHAVAGRTFPLLGKNKERTLMAFCLLASFPGSLGIMYGDEIAMDNVPMSELTETQQKDTRNINRGLLKFEAKDNPDNKWFFEKMSDILNKRRSVSYYMNIEPTLGDENTQVLTARYMHGISELLVFINITGKEIVLEPETERFEPVLTVNSASCEPGKVILGPYGCIWLQR